MYLVLDPLKICVGLFVYLLVNALTSIPFKFLRYDISYVARTDLRHWINLFWTVPLRNPIATAFWISFMIPVVEEVLFFALPRAVLGALSLVPMLVWATAHVVNGVENLTQLRPFVRNFRTELVKVITFGALHYVSVGVTSWILWRSGLGLASILGHMINNFLVGVRDIVSVHRFHESLRRAKQRHCGYVERYL